MFLAQADYLEAGNTLAIVVFAVVTTKWLEAKSATELLREFKAQFLTANSTNQFRNAHEGDRDVLHRSQPIIQTIMSKYGRDILAKVQRQADDLRDQMQNNVDAAFTNLVTVQELDKKSEDLEAQAVQFDQSATSLRRHFCLQYWKMNLAIALVVIIIIIIIVASICSQSGKCKS